MPKVGIVALPQQFRNQMTRTNQTITRRSAFQAARDTSDPSS